MEQNSITFGISRFLQTTSTRRLGVRRLEHDHSLRLNENINRSGSVDRRRGRSSIFIFPQRCVTKAGGFFFWTNRVCSTTHFDEGPSMAGTCRADKFDKTGARSFGTTVFGAGRLLLFSIRLFSSGCARSSSVIVVRCRHQGRAHGHGGRVRGGIVTRQ